jgi:hypothetical protein
MQQNVMRCAPPLLLLLLPPPPPPPQPQPLDAIMMITIAAAPC